MTEELVPAGASFEILERRSPATSFKIATLRSVWADHGEIDEAILSLFLDKIVTSRKNVA